MKSRKLFSPKLCVTTYINISITSYCLDAPITANGFNSHNTTEDHCAGGSSGGLIRLKANTVNFLLHVLMIYNDSYVLCLVEVSFFPRKGEKQKPLLSRVIPRFRFQPSGFRTRPRYFAPWRKTRTKPLRMEIPTEFKWERHRDHVDDVWVSCTLHRWEPAQ